MKKILLLLIVTLIFIQKSYAQNVGISSTAALPNPSAMLDIVSLDKGLLIPRVALTGTADAASITNGNVTSLLVYNTATAGVAPNDVTPGYYYWDGSEWVRFFTGSQSDDWTLLGNAGTNPATNFIGTTDAQDFVVKANSTEKIRVESAGDVIIGSTGAGKVQIYNDTENSTFKLGDRTGSSSWSHIWRPGTSSNFSQFAFSDTRTTLVNEDIFFDVWNIGGGYSEGAMQIYGDQGFTVDGAQIQVSDVASLPNKCSKFEINSTTGGFLVPRMGVASKNAIDVSSAVGCSPEGCLIYQVENVVTRSPGGFWFFDDERTLGQWTQLLDANAGWTTLGNTGTDDATNFIGTTDGQDFVFKSNNIERMRIQSSDGDIGVGTTIPTDMFQVKGTFGIEETGAGTARNTFQTSTSQSSSYTYTLPLNDGTNGEVLTTDGSGVLDWTSAAGGADADWEVIGNNVVSGHGGLYPSGNVGIGTTVPLSKLEIRMPDNASIEWGALRLTNIREQAAVGYGVGIKFKNVPTDAAAPNYQINRWAGIAGVSEGSWGQQMALVFYTNANAAPSSLAPIEKMRLTNDGHLKVLEGSIYIPTSTTTDGIILINNNRFMHNYGGVYCTYLGEYAGRLNATNTGQRNTAVGAWSLDANTTGSFNTAIGEQTLSQNTTGGYNTAIGRMAMYQHQTGNYNFAGGYQAMYFSRTTCDYNVAIGYHAMYNGANYTGAHSNIAIGREALYNVDNTNNNNIAIGYRALYSQSSNENIGIGALTLYNNEGFRNVGIMTSALHDNTTGDENIGIGYHTLYSNTTGDNNIAMGFEALIDNNGDDNIAMGYYALHNSTSGTDNIAIGYGTLNGISTGDQNTAIGTSAYSSGNYTNSTAIGFNAAINGSNQVHLGNTSVTEVEGQVSYATYSDGRIKENVSENVKGLEFITKLRPVTYNINKHKQDEIMGITDDSEYAEKYDIEKIVFTGFIAQEVEQAAADCGYDFSGVNTAKHEKDLYSLKYAEFVVPLVKATQEQQEIIEQQQQTINNQEQKNIELENRVEQLEKDIEELKKLMTE